MISDLFSYTTKIFLFTGYSSQATESETECGCEIAPIIGGVMALLIVERERERERERDRERNEYYIIIA